VTRATTTQLIAKRLPNLNSRKRLALKPSLDPERSFWPSFMKKINALKRHLQLKPENTESSKNWKNEHPLY
jgi:hypothetical protein